jgi:transcriptional regulator with XRE-family HTH domain
MDYVELAAALIAKLRGKWSQERLSKKLGYRSNVVYLWERKRRMPAVSVFFEVAELRRCPVVEGLRGFFAHGHAGGLEPRRASGAYAVPAMVRRMAGDQTKLELARLTSIDRATIARWMRGTTEPRLPEFLQFLDKVTLRLLEFVALFTDPSAIDATRRAYAEYLAQKELAYAAPWSHAVLHALDLSVYRELSRHRTSVLTERLGLPAAEVEAQLLALERAGCVEKQRGLYRQVRPLSLDTSGNFEKNRALKQFFARELADRVGSHAPHHHSLFSYNLFPISARDLERLRELHLDYFRRVRQLVANATGADHVVVMNLHLCALDESRPPH